MHLITIRDQVCNVMASPTKTFVSPDIVLQNLEAITACSSCTKVCTETTWSSVVLWTAAMTGGNHITPPPATVTDTPSSFSMTSKLQAACKLPSSTLALSVGLASEQQGSLQNIKARQWLVQGPKLLDSLLTLFFTHLWWPWWSQWCSSPGNS